MAGRRINKILSVLRDQWHVIDLHDCITRDFLVNNTQDFLNSLLERIRWPSKYDEYDIPYKLLDNSCSEYQFIFERNQDENYEYNYDNSGLEKELEKFNDLARKAKDEYKPGKKYKSTG